MDLYVGRRHIPKDVRPFRIIFHTEKTVPAMWSDLVNFENLKLCSSLDNWGQISGAPAGVKEEMVAPSNSEHTAHHSTLQDCSVFNLGRF